MKVLRNSILLMSLFVLANCDNEPDDPRDAFVGIWDAEIEEDCEFSHSEYDEIISISKGSAKNKLLLSVDGESLEATLSGKSFTIPAQMVDDEEQINGSGNFSGTSIYARLVYKDFDNDEKCDITINGNKR